MTNISLCVDISTLVLSPIDCSNLLLNNDIPSISSTSHPCPITNSITGLYQSPLLTFKAYRTNPLYRTLFKLPLTSLTHSHSINPFIPLCRYESKGGKCMDTSCKGQHINNITLTNEQLAKELLSYSPHIVQSPDVNMSPNDRLLLIAHNVHQQQPSITSTATLPIDPLTTASIPLSINPLTTAVNNTQKLVASSPISTTVLQTHSKRYTCVMYYDT